MIAAPLRVALALRDVLALSSLLGGWDPEVRGGHPDLLGVIEGELSHASSLLKAVDAGRSTGWDGDRTVRATDDLAAVFAYILALREWRRAGAPPAARPAHPLGAELRERISDWHRVAAEARLRTPTSGLVKEICELALSLESRGEPVVASLALRALERRVGGRMRAGEESLDDGLAELAERLTESSQFGPQRDSRCCIPAGFLFARLDSDRPGFHLLGLPSLFESGGDREMAVAAIRRCIDAMEKGRIEVDGGEEWLEDLRRDLERLAGPGR